MYPKLKVYYILESLQKQVTHNSVQGSSHEIQVPLKINSHEIKLISIKELMPGELTLWQLISWELI